MEFTLSPPQKLPLGIPIKIDIIEKIDPALSFSFFPASQQQASAEERGTCLLKGFFLLDDVCMETN